MTSRAFLLLASSLAGAGSFGFLFIEGLRRQKVVSFSNLRVERGQAPVLYWVFQSYYAIVMIALAFGASLLACDYRFGAAPMLDKLAAILFGSFFLLGAAMCGVFFVTGLRTGVAIRRVWGVGPAPPSRKKHAFRYWGLQAMYAFMTILTAGLGIGFIAVAIAR
jgi:hypothetical protein